MNITIEHIIDALLKSGISLTEWDKRIAASFKFQLDNKLGLTEKQNALILKIIKKHEKNLSNFLNVDIKNCLENPVYITPIKKQNSPEVRVIKDDVKKELISVKFPYNLTLINKFKEDCKGCKFQWDHENKSWIFQMNENNIKVLTDFVNNQYSEFNLNFEIDEKFKKYSLQISDIINNLENYAPMLVLDNGIPKLKNVDKYVPQLTTTDILESLFQSRRRGISAWDIDIEKFLENNHFNSVTRLFLNSDPGKIINIDRSHFELSDLTDIVKFMGPCLVNLPGGREHETLVKFYEFFKTLGIDETQMSVMFRLPTESNTEFNNFVKTTKLNLPIHSETKIAFISCKLPKTVLKSKIKFNSIITYKLQSHYTLQNFIRNFENVIFI
jgi:hypothetical protein